MQLNELRPATGSQKAKKRVGRGTGSGWGKTCGTGHKGQKSRSGGTVKPGFEGGQMPLQMRLPKYGFSSRIGRVTAEIRSSELNQIEGDVVNLESLKAAGLITSSIKRAKIMLSGEVTKKVTVEGIGVTKGAKAAIEKAGGKVVEAAAEEKKAKPAKKAKAAKAEEAPAAEAPAEEASAEEAPAASDEEKGEE